jgi:hypothetical protein
MDNPRVAIARDAIKEDVHDISTLELSIPAKT